jgi:hypothetical protein
MPLPKIFKPKKNFSLIRCGRNNDGGYLLSKNVILETNFLISFGILDDISFEKDFLNINQVKNYCYDKSLVKSYWKKKFFNDLAASIYNLNFNLINNTFRKYIEFKSFFKNNNTILNIEIIKKNSIKNIINYHKLEKNIFFKIDIEGSEYRILDELINNQDKICGLVIEFHDIDLHREKIENFIEKFNLTLTHTHPNNYGGVDEQMDPIVIEMTFEKNPSQEDDAKFTLPNLLDQPNNPLEEDIILNFA